MNKKLLFSIILLFLGITTEAQDYFYYYKDKKIYLNLNLYRVTVNSKQNSYEYIREKYNNVSFSGRSKNYIKNILIDNEGKRPNLKDNFYFN